MDLSCGRISIKVERDSRMTSSATLLYGTNVEGVALWLLGGSQARGCGHGKA